MAEAAKAFDPTTDSWAPGELLAGMPSANAGKDVTADIASAKRAEIGATDKIYGDLQHTLSTAIPKIEQLSKDAGVEAEKLKPWNAEEESAKHHTDPIAAFGSLGSAFGILASAFTHAPMENALNASAAAMNAIHAGDDKEYNRAYKAWEANTKQTLERHRIEHDAYQDAVALLHTNMEAAGMKLKIAAARFGDQKMLAMLDAGMDKEVIDVINARQKIALQLAEKMPKIALDNTKLADLIQDPRFKLKPDDPRRAELIQEWQKRWNPQIGEAYLRYNETQRHNKEMESIAKGKGDVIEKRLEEIERHNKEMEKIGAKRAEAAGGDKDLTTKRQRAQDVAAFRKKLRAEEKEDGTVKWSPEEIAHKAAEYERKLKSEATPITANRADELQGKIDRVTHAEHIVDQIDGLLLKHKAITGLGGMLTRPPEIVSNLIGGSQTDREEFKRLVETMRFEAPRILLDTQGRPISAEAERVNSIIAGLSPGDTGPNTIRAYVEFRRELKEIKADFEKRKGTKKTESDASAKTTHRPSWRDAPVVNP